MLLLHVPSQTEGGEGAPTGVLTHGGVTLVVEGGTYYIAVVERIDGLSYQRYRAALRVVGVGTSHYAAHHGVAQFG